MRDFVKKVQESKHDFAKELICIIPSSKMRHAFKRKLLEEVAHFNHLRFMTFQEWILHETEDYRLERGLQIIDPLAQEMWVLEQMEKSNLQTHQHNLTTAKAIVREFMFLRTHGLGENHVNERTRSIFTRLFEKYNDFLTAKQAVDYPQLLHVVLKECEKYETYLRKNDAPSDEPVFPRMWEIMRQRNSTIVLAAGVGLTIVEKNIVQLMNLKRLKDNLHIHSVAAYGFENAVEHALMPIHKGDISPDKVHFVYTNASLLPTIYQKVQKLKVPATFASGIPIELTEAYYFVTKMIYYIENNYPLYVLHELASANLLNVTDPFVFNKLVTTDGMTTGTRFLAIIEHELAKENPIYTIKENYDKTKLLLEEITELQNLITEITSDQSNQLISFITLFTKFYHHRSKTEVIAKKTIENLLQGANAVIDNERFELSDLLTFINGQFIQAQAEEEGHLYISSLADVGPLYRNNYCWFGMTVEEFGAQGNNHPFVNEESLATLDIPSEEEKLSQLEDKLEEHLQDKDVNHTLYLTKIHMERRQENNPILTYHKYAGEAEEVGYPKPAYTNDKENHPLTSEAHEEISLKIEEDSYSKVLYARDKTTKDLFVFSPTSARELVQCSRKFMYERVMGLRDYEVDEPERNRWLAFNLLGNLYHEVLENYVNEAMEGVPNVEDIIEVTFSKYRKKYPPMYEELYLEEKERATEVMKNFVKRFTEDDEQGWRTLQAEASFGSKDEPITIELDDEMFIHINGQIDRVDYQEEQNMYRVTDYKTGKVNNTNDLQIALYEKAYKALLDDEAVFSGSYFDYILNNERTIVSDAESELANFKEQLLNFKDHWDDVDYEEILKSKVCNYCHFKHLCAIRNKEVKS